MYNIGDKIKHKERGLVETIVGFCKIKYMGSWGFYVNIVGDYKYEDNQESIILYPDDVGIDWLNKNHFDYRGLIEKGLAIDATGLNVY